MVNVTNRAHVYVRLRTREFFLSHDPYLESLCLVISDSKSVRRLQLAFFMTASATLFGTSMYFANSIVNVARPWLIERTDVA